MPVVIGAAVSIVLGVYGRLHDPTGIAVSFPGFSGPQPLKAWTAAAAICGSSTPGTPTGLA